MVKKSDHYKWMFIGDVPLLYDEKRLARQFQVWFWLNPEPVLEEMGLKKLKEDAQAKVKGYVS